MRKYALNGDHRFMCYQINQKPIASCVAWLLLLAMCLGVFVTPAWAISKKTDPQMQTEHTTLPLSALVSHLVGLDLSDTEKAWLDV